MSQGDRLWRKLPARLAGLVVVALFFCGARPSAATDRPLAALVPRDVGLCIEARDLSARLPEFKAGTIFARLQQFPPLQRFLTENDAAIRGLTQEIERQTGLTADEILSKLLGHRVLVAVWPGAADVNAPPGPALVMFECDTEAVLSGVLRRLLEAERAAGRSTETWAWRKGPFVRDIHRINVGADHPALFVAASGNLGMVSTDQRKLESALSFDVGMTPGGALADQSAYLDSMAQLNPQSVLRGFVNPQAWKTMPESPLSQAKGETLDAGNRLWNLFCTAKTLVFSLELGDQVTVEAFLRQPADSSRSAAVASSSASEDIAERLPADVLAAIGGHIDLPRLLGSFFRDCPANPQESSGAPPDLGLAEAWGALSSGSGNHALAALMARPPEATSAPSELAGNSRPGLLPADWVIGLDTRDLLPDERLTFGERLSPMLRGALTAAIMAYNQHGRPMTVESAAEDGVPLTSVSGLNLLGQGDTAAFSLLNGYYWAGTSRAAVRDIARVDNQDSLAASDHYRAMLNPRISARTHLAYVDLARLRPLIRDVEEKANSRAQADLQLPKTDAAYSPALLELMALADRVLVELQIDESLLSISATFAADAAQ